MLVHLVNMLDVNNVMSIAVSVPPIAELTGDFAALHQCIALSRLDRRNLGLAVPGLAATQVKLMAHCRWRGLAANGYRLSR